MTKKQYAALIGIVLIAIFFRFWKLVHVDVTTTAGLPSIHLTADMPGGLFPDEAANGLDILLMEQGHLQPFYERGNGREALFFYMIWGMVKLFGIGVWQHHATSAIVGTCAVILSFLVSKELFSLFIVDKKYKKQVIWWALLVAFFMATNSWHTVLSRTAFRANLIPLFSGLTMYFMLVAYRTKHKNWAAIWFGASFALGFYTYIAFRIMVPILGTVILYPAFIKVVTDRSLKKIRSFILPTLISIAAFIVVIFPIAHYFYTHSGSFIGRSGQVSVFNPELNHGDLPGTVLEVAKESLLAFFTQGDLNYRHNISGLPFLSPLLSIFFAVGLLVCVYRGTLYFFTPNKRALWWMEFFLCVWFFGMLLPVITTAEGIPHGLRSIGMIPTVFIISTLGIFYTYIASEKLIAWKLAYIKECKPHFLYYKRQPFLMYALKWVSIFAAGIYLVALPLQTYAEYFIGAYNDPANFYSFRSDLTNVSDYLKQTGSKQNTYLVLDKFSIQTVDYLTAADPKHPNNPVNQPYTQVDPENVYNIKQLHPLHPGAQIVFTQSSIFDIKKFKQYNPNARLVYEERNKFGQAVVAVYEWK